MRLYLSPLSVSERMYIGLENSQAGLQQRQPFNLFTIRQRCLISKIAFGICLSLLMLMAPSRVSAQQHTTQTQVQRACYVLPTNISASPSSLVCQRNGYWRMQGYDQVVIKRISPQDILGEPRIYELAKQNDANAKIKIAVASLMGENKLNKAKALNILSEMASNGNVLAMHNLASYYHYLGGVEYYSEAARRYIDAAEKGLVQSQNSAGFMYLRGWGVPQNFIAARAYFINAAEKGSVSAFNNLGLLYSKAFFGFYDIQKSISWYKRGLDARPLFYSSKICSVLSDEKESGIGFTQAELMLKRYLWCSITSRLPDPAISSGDLMDNEDKDEIWGAQNFARDQLKATRLKYASLPNGSVNLKRGDQIVELCLRNGVASCQF
jgi:hypothetical protein